jgi:hypothetical protein
LLARRIALDAALASLELAVLLLEQGRMAEVREIATELLPVFKAQNVTIEALATVQLFCEAAHRETLTADMARRYLNELRKAGPPTRPAEILRNAQEVAEPGDEHLSRGRPGTLHLGRGCTLRREKRRAARAWPPRRRTGHWGRGCTLRLPRRR